ncbi:hypothetical protein GC425_01690 [Corynebacterium sp. zg254]|uniref:Secreted protein n=1 Tax=Corynebacterium zhongnanshanii TaxID=2768834 RepID=A0ABQ6VFV7_9CORY|nr:MULTISPECIES: hypothetical protein [Corynebacterium]KAB3523294.1 hypothetical protein F8377_03935 [Corynebacterium zhongnanshanii]MCR5913585.1 hypothetical protein [Corynebacterium sp. zg254]
MRKERKDTLGATGLAGILGAILAIPFVLILWGTVCFFPGAEWHPHMQSPISIALLVILFFPCSLAAEFLAARISIKLLPTHNKAGQELIEALFAFGVICFLITPVAAAAIATIIYGCVTALLERLILSS